MAAVSLLEKHCRAGLIDKAGRQLLHIGWASTCMYTADSLRHIRSISSSLALGPKASTTCDTQHAQRFSSHTEGAGLQAKYSRLPDLQTAQLQLGHAACLLGALYQHWAASAPFQAGPPYLTAGAQAVQELRAGPLFTRAQQLEFTQGRRLQAGLHDESHLPTKQSQVAADG